MRVFLYIFKKYVYLLGGGGGSKYLNFIFLGIYIFFCIYYENDKFFVLYLFWFFLLVIIFEMYLNYIL